MATSSTTDVWDVIAVEAGRESALWEAALRPDGLRERRAVFSPLAEPRYALGLETVYEGYLLHYGQARIFAPRDEDTALLLGDYLYAHGLVRIAELEVVQAVADLAELISLCAQVRADGREADGPAWAATAACLGAADLSEPRDALRLDADPTPLYEVACAAAGRAAVDRALAGHEERAG